MKLSALATTAAERMDIPDRLLRAGIAARVADSARQLARSAGSDADFAAWMARHPIALHTEAANAQHYELPPAFFAAVLGRHGKYSSCFYPTGAETLDQAEQAALEATCAMAALEDGQRVLELGCGWGSLSLFMAARFPNTKIVAVSNARPQRLHIEGLAAARGLMNIEVRTADMNDLAPEGCFDRILSVEMFEHMTNWRALLTRMQGWLAQDGRVFVHVFSHAKNAYRFDHEHGADWIARYFFTGGIMPSHHLMHRFEDIFEVIAERRWPGTHYQRTALHWLAHFDRNRGLIDPLLRKTYGVEAPLWRRRWRLFFLAVAGLFGHAEGEVWGVSQYLLRTR
jgi:cyclopropane-fatty-acyl-phospholipid synthase